MFSEENWTERELLALRSSPCGKGKLHDHTQEKQTVLPPAHPRVCLFIISKVKEGDSVFWVDRRCPCRGFCQITQFTHFWKASFCNAQRKFRILVFSSPLHVEVVFSRLLTAHQLKRERPWRSLSVFTVRIRCREHGTFTSYARSEPQLVSCRSRSDLHVPHTSEMDLFFTQLRTLGWDFGHTHRNFGPLSFLYSCFQTSQSEYWTRRGQQALTFGNGFEKSHSDSLLKSRRSPFRLWDLTDWKRTQRKQSFVRIRSNRRQRSLCGEPHLCKKDNDDADFEDGDRAAAQSTHLCW